MQEMLFGKLNFKKRLNITVRSGSEWSNRLDVGEKFIAGNDRSGFKTAKVRGNMTCDLGMLRDGDLRGVLLKEHDPDARDYKGLKDTLQRIYGEDEIDDETLVTVVFFDIID